MQDGRLAPYPSPDSPLCTRMGIMVIGGGAVTLERDRTHLVFGPLGFDA